MLLYFSMLFLWLTLKEWSGKSNKEGQKIRFKNEPIKKRTGMMAKKTLLEHMKE